MILVSILNYEICLTLAHTTIHIFTYILIAPSQVLNFAQFIYKKKILNFNFF